MTARESLGAARLYGIVDLAYISAEHAPRVAAQMIEGGVDVLQLRAKDESPMRIQNLARLLHPILRASAVPFIINDHPEIAAAVDCEGVHVGQDDASVVMAREFGGAGRIVGKSTHDLTQAEAAAAEGADYIGFGPLFPTPTKPGRPAIGTADIHEVHRRVSIPVFCIGGVKLENLAAIVAAGARRVVMVSGILEADDIANYIRQAKALLPDLRDTERKNGRASPAGEPG
ncbi:MAG: thiamine phosphate synthase [Verrucomicrobiales bacterium]